MAGTSISSLFVRDLTVAYGQHVALWDVAFDLPKGKLVGIVGPNGAGKSTLLQAVMGLLPLRSGEVKLFGQAMDRKKRAQIAYVPQRKSVDWEFPASVEEVVMMGCYGRLGLFNRPGKKEKEAVSKALAAVEMDGHRKKQIGELSGGQQQRVFIARALMQEADLYLMDEPLAGVDARSEQLILGILKKLCKTNKTLLIVFHSLQLVKQHFDWLLLLNRRLVAAGPIQDVFSQENMARTYGSELPLLSEISERLGKTTTHPEPKPKA